MGIIAGLLFFLLIIGLSIAGIIFVISLFSKRSKDDAEEDSLVDFEKRVRALYVYLILICLLLGMIAGGILLFNSAVDYFLPEEQYSQYEERYNQVTKNQSKVDVATSLAILGCTIPLFIQYSNISREETLKTKKEKNK